AYNGEVYNFKELRSELEALGIQFSSTSDTEVVLYMLIKYGEKALDRFNGFFSLAFVDKEENTLLLARDKFGIKPLYYYLQDDHIAFSSELRPLMRITNSKKIDPDSLRQYFQLTYISAPYTILKDVHKLEAGYFMKLSTSKVHKEAFFKLEYVEAVEPTDPDTANSELREILTRSVERRVVADVPVGTFLSGGVDSSIISALASRFHSKIKTFSIGFSDDPYYDETRYAEMMAKKIGTDHHSFRLTKGELYESALQLLDTVDEPFADSSAIAVNLLSAHTRKEVTVALSGDGADEIFGGYNKHKAYQLMVDKGIKSGLLKLGSSLFQRMEGTRGSFFGNKLRQLNKFAGLQGLENKDLYWHLCTFMSDTLVNDLLSVENEQFHDRKEAFLSLAEEPGMNRFLLNDIKQVLANDMLVKTDRMSMLNSLEVRVPFLDPEVVSFANRLPASYKVGKTGKQILKNAFSDILPAEILKRPKQGFEVPIKEWLENEFGSELAEVAAKDYINDQGLFNHEAVESMIGRMNSKEVGDAPTHCWSFLTFQKWWAREIA
ncbi:MAG: asparagine synthase (glutamine-hydrolyzing), partial [Bacteroidetes bacterium]|nr:asparagine synthase (glutamine-hydrolyzing) [Bacteroidota bacterium]